LAYSGYQLLHPTRSGRWCASVVNVGK